MRTLKTNTPNVLFGAAKAGIINQNGDDFDRDNLERVKSVVGALEAAQKTNDFYRSKLDPLYKLRARQLYNLAAEFSGPARPAPPELRLAVQVFYKYRDARDNMAEKEAPSRRERPSVLPARIITSYCTLGQGLYQLLALRRAAVAGT